MTKAFMVAALAAASVATEIVFKTGGVWSNGSVDEDSKTRRSDFKKDADEWPMQFQWPRNYSNWRSYRCTATLVAPQVALTAAHCVRESENGILTGGAQPKVKIAGQYRKVKEIRVPECWDFSRQGPLNVDVALLILNWPVRDVVAGVDYAKIWDPAEQADDIMEGDEFILAGYGTWAPWNVWQDQFYSRDLRSGPLLHQGFNIIETLRSNFVYYRMTNQRFGGLKYEAGGSFGDSGSGALYEKDDLYYIIGVLSHGYYNEDEDGNRYQRWNALGAYTRTSGASLQWIKANMADLNNATPASDCGTWATNASTQSLPSFGSMPGDQTPDGYIELFTEDDDIGLYGNPGEPYFDCPCDCAEDEEEDAECWAVCDECLGNAIDI